MKNRTNSCKKWLAVLLSVSMLPTAILQNGSMAYAEEKKQEEAVTAEEALETGSRYRRRRDFDFQ